MELMQAEEIFEVNSNSTTDTLKEQRLARNKELRLKATYLVSRRPIKNQQKDYNSESSSEFPASSPSNPQMQRKSQYQSSRPPLLKNTLPADAFERGLALIATKEPQMTMSEKIESWQCVTEEFSDVEDVVNFDAVFEQREENKIKLLSKTKYELKNKTQKDSNAADPITGDTCYSFTEFQRRLLAIDPRKTISQGSEQKHNSKLTSEEDEKPTTSSNCLARNRDTPLKKRACKYKRAAEPIAHLPNKKSSSSDTPRDGAPSPKKKVQQQKLSAATAAGEDGHQFNEKMVCPSSSDASSQLVKNDSTNIGANARNLRSQAQTKLKPSKIIEATAINSNWNRAIPSVNPARNDEQDAFFRWRRLSREIDKIGNVIEVQQNAYQKHPRNSSPKEKKGLIQIRYDFLEPSNSSMNINPEKSTYNVVVKTLKKEEVLERPTDVISTNNPAINSKNEQNTEGTQQQTVLKSEKPCTKTDQVKETESANTKNKDDIPDSGTEFHQQHEFCNYLGLTGMSTANAMANAAAELSKCNLARRSLRVRHLEQRKAKSKPKSEISKTACDRYAKEKQETPNNLTGNSTLPARRKYEDDIVESSKNTRKKSSVGTASLRSETKRNDTNNTALNASVPCIQIAKDNEAKIKILCQIATSSKEKEEHTCNEPIDKLTTRTLKQQNQKSNLQKTSKSNAKKILTVNAEAQENSNHIKSDEVDTKYIELLAKTPNNQKSDINILKASEVQTLHEKVQKCLEEARQNAPNIFIVKSLDSTSATVKGKQEGKIELPDHKLSQMFTADAKSSRSKRSSQSNKSTQVNNSGSSKTKKRGTRGNIKKTASGRRLYTRSMLNLNQQRELRNRKVILKILKTYSGLKIKVSKPKDKQSIQAKKGNQRDTKPNEGQQIQEVAPAIALKSVGTINASNIETTSAAEQINSNKKLNDSSIEIKITSDGDTAIESKQENILLGNKNIEYEAEISKTFKDETKTVFQNENINLTSNQSIFTENYADSRQEQTSSSNVLTNKLQADLAVTNSDSENKIPAISGKSAMKSDNMTEVAVQTEPTPSIQPLQVFAGRIACKAQESMQLRHINAEMDVSSSDIVTSTTSGVGEHNRCEQKTPSNLVAKELYGNFYIDESIAGAADALHPEATSASHLIESNPLANVSISSTINELGIHALCASTKAIQNPLQIADGSVLHIYYECDILIVVQETLISFWKYMRVFNALTMKPRDFDVDELHCKSKFTNNCNTREVLTPELQSSTATVDFRNCDFEGTTKPLMNVSEWLYLGEKKRLNTDIEIGSPYMNRLCLSESRPVYIEMRCRELLNDFRECNLLSCYVNVYFFNEEDQLAICHSIQLDSIQSLPSDVIYTAINDSRYFVLAWPQANVLGKVRSGLCKYALTPELDMLATTRDFKAMRHILRSLECLNDGKLLGFGDTQLTVWDHRSGDVLMNYDLNLPLGRNLGTIYYPSLESEQNNVVVLIQHVLNETSSELVVIACTISHMNPSRRILLRHRLPTPMFYNIRNGINNGEHFIIQSRTGEEILISCNDPRQLMFVPAQRSERFYMRGRTQIIELTKETLTVDSFSSYLLKIAAGLNVQKTIVNKNKNNKNNKNWCV